MMRDLTLNEAIDAIPDAINARTVDLCENYQMRMTVAAAVGITLATLYREGLIDWTTP